MTWRCALIAILLTVGLTPLASAAPLALTLQPACESAANRRTSGAALVLALRQKHWIIRGADLEEGHVSARACRPRICVTVDAAIDAQGRVEVSATKRQRGREVVTNLPRNWEWHLDNAYNSFSCYEPDRLFDLYDRHRYPRFGAMNNTVPL